MNEFVAVDIETTGLYPLKGRDKIFCVAVKDRTGTRLYESPSEIQGLKPMLENPRITKVIHNAKFDCFWLKRLCNIDVHKVWDTRLMEQVLIGENLPRSNKDEAVQRELSSSLKYTLLRYGLAELDKSVGKGFATRNQNAPLTRVEREYAMNDVKYLLQLQALQEYRLLKLDLMKVANLENKLVETVVRMQGRGVGFDKSTWLELAIYNSAKRAEILKRLPSSVSNWNSPAQVKKYFQSVGIPMDSLQQLEELLPVYNNKVLQLFGEARALYKATTTYGEGWLTDDFKGGNTVDPDNRVRASFEQILNTGRFSCSNPNLQQIPREGEHRKAFVPARGNVFILGDFSSQEIGIAAAASKEETWIKAILRGEDVHSLTATLIFSEEWRAGTEKGCTFPKKCKCSAHVKLREYAKVTNFTIIYGGGPGNISQKTKLSMKEAQKLVMKFKRAVPKLTRWLEANGAETVKTRISYSADPFRRRRTVRDPEDWQLRNVGKNNPIQSCGANMIKLSMVSIPEAMSKAGFPIVLTIHDELVLEVRKGEAGKAVKILKEVMEKAADYCTEVPGLIKVEPRIALNLAK